MVASLRLPAADLTRPPSLMYTGPQSAVSPVYGIGQNLTQRKSR